MKRSNKRGRAPTSQKSAAKKKTAAKTKAAPAKRRPPPDPIATFAPKANPEQRAALEKLRARAGDIEQWMAADPARAEMLKADPKRALDELSRALNLPFDGTIRRQRVPDLTVASAPLPVGAALLKAIWLHAASSAANTQAFLTNPGAEIQSVAAATNATADEANAVLAAFDLRANLQVSAALNRFHDVALQVSTARSGLVLDLPRKP